MLAKPLNFNVLLMHMHILKRKQKLNYNVFCVLNTAATCLLNQGVRIWCFSLSFSWIYAFIQSKVFPNFKQNISNPIQLIIHFTSPKIMITTYYSQKVYHLGKYIYNMQSTPPFCPPPPFPPHLLPLHSIHLIKTRLFQVFYK